MPYDPAGALDLPHVANGLYTVSVLNDNLDEAGTLQYQIYTVTRGSLRGQRIVKWFDPGESRYVGFATLLRDGSRHLWQRFQPVNTLWKRIGIQFTTPSFVEPEATPLDYMDNRAAGWIGVEHGTGGRFADRFRVRLETPCCTGCNNELDTHTVAWRDWRTAHENGTSLAALTPPNWHRGLLCTACHERLYPPPRTPEPVVAPEPIDAVRQRYQPRARRRSASSYPTPGAAPRMSEIDGEWLQ